MAQLVERLVRNEEASGSNPLSSTKKARTAFAVRENIIHYQSTRPLARRIHHSTERSYTYQARDTPHKRS